MPADSGVPRFYDLSGYTILVIDDHEDSLFLVLELLRHCHADVIGASDTDEARRILHERIPDLIITDLNLPRETGLQFAEWVREAAPNEMLRRAPIIAITATSPRITVAGHPAIDAFVRKPIELDHICEVISEVLRQRRPPSKP